MSITFPDVNSICSAIETLTMNVTPFQEINLFRQRCFASFAINQRKGLTLTQVLHLYIAAYQKREIWKQCWKRIYPVMSTQIARSAKFSLPVFSLFFLFLLTFFSTQRRRIIRKYSSIRG